MVKFLTTFSAEVGYRFQLSRRIPHEDWTLWCFKQQILSFSFYVKWRIKWQCSQKFSGDVTFENADNVISFPLALPCLSVISTVFHRVRVDAKFWWHSVGSTNLSHRRKQNFSVSRLDKYDPWKIPTTFFGLIMICSLKSKIYRCLSSEDWNSHPITVSISYALLVSHKAAKIAFTLWCFFGFHQSGPCWGFREKPWTIKHKNF